MHSQFSVTNRSIQLYPTLGCHNSQFSHEAAINKRLLSILQLSDCMTVTFPIRMTGINNMTVRLTVGLPTHSSVFWGH